MAIGLIGAFTAGAQRIGTSIMNTEKNIQKRKVELLNEQKELNAAAAKDTYQYGEMAAENALNRDEQWYLKYGSPQAMRKQLEAAGLNPALMHGAGAGSGGGTGNSQQGTGATVTPANVAEATMTDQQMKMNTVQGALMVAQTLKTLGEAHKLGIDKKKINAEIKNIDANTETEIQHAQALNIKAALDDIEFRDKMWERGGTGWNKNFRLIKDATGELVNEEIPYEQTMWGMERMIKNKLMKMEETISDETALQLARATMKLAKHNANIQQYEDEVNQILNTLGKGGQYATGIMKTIFDIIKIAKSW